MSKYAERTKVPVNRSIAEIQKTLERYGADQFIQGRDDKLKKVFVQFRILDRYIKIIISIDVETEQELRQRFRALALVIKAKLEYIESGNSTLDEQFMSDMLLPNGETIGTFMLPQIDDIYQNNEMPKMLTFGGDGNEI